MEDIVDHCSSQTHAPSFPHFFGLHQPAPFGSFCHSLHQPCIFYIGMYPALHDNCLMESACRSRTQAPSKGKVQSCAVSWCAVADCSWQLMHTACLCTMQAGPSVQMMRPLSHGTKPPVATALSGTLCVHACVGDEHNLCTCHIRVDAPGLGLPTAWVSAWTDETYG